MPAATEFGPFPPLPGGFAVRLPDSGVNRPDTYRKPGINLRQSEPVMMFVPAPSPATLARSNRGGCQSQ